MSKPALSLNEAASGRQVNGYPSAGRCRFVAHGGETERTARAAVNDESRALASVVLFGGPMTRSTTISSPFKQRYPQLSDLSIMKIIHVACYQYFQLAIWIRIPALGRWLLSSPLVHIRDILRSIPDGTYVDAARQCHLRNPLHRPLKPHPQPSPARSITR